MATHAQKYRDAVWDSTELTSTQKIVALCFANHAKGTDKAWVSYSRIAQQTGIRSPTTISHTLAQLETLGWLAPVGPKVQRRKVYYRLTTPDAPTPVSGAGAAPETGAAEDTSAPAETSICSSADPNLLHGSAPTAPETGDDSLDSRDSLVPESQRQADDAAATLRAAPPPANGNHRPVALPTLPADKAKALARDVARRGLARSRTSHTPTRPRPPDTGGALARAADQDDHDREGEALS
ncbi:helix-turn-helix domain-containing protein [Dactylosporangium sp. CA-092794]|uniref:helix-turn-helix domain-containing protein n=1 Tax=Dactylosporangium sp. CA-092794 TaxID=3239929 RepID=UPI003D93CC53